MAETAASSSQHRPGIALIVAAAVAWSTAAVFTWLLPFDSWTILFWRGLFGGGVIAAMLMLTRGRAPCGISPEWEAAAGWSPHCRGRRLAKPVDRLRRDRAAGSERGGVADPGRG